jgi:hypothetical protein
MESHCIFSGWSTQDFRFARRISHMEQNEMAIVMEALKICRTKIWAIELYLTKKGLIDTDEFRAFTKEVDKQFSVGDEVTELDRMLGLKPDGL